MNFYQKYELERLVADGETKTFRAVENATGRTVFLHFFNPEGLSILAALKSKLEKTPGKPELPLIELGEFAGSPYAVTERIDPFTTLRQWVDSLKGYAPQPDDDTTRTVEIPKPVLAPKTQAGEFTRMFEAPPKVSPVAETQGGEFTRFFGASPESRKPVSPRAPQAGEFTQFFGAGASPPKAEAPKQPKPPKPRAPEAGEFTRWFDPSPGAASQPAPPPNNFEDLFDNAGAPLRSNTSPPQPSSNASWPASAPSDLETGQFTRLFGSGPSGEAINIEEEQARAARAKQPESRPFQAPTEFTRMFGPEEGSNAPPPRTMRMDSASGIFGSIDDLKSEELKTAVPATTTKSAGPGEYTRMTTRAELEAEQAALEQSMQASVPPPPPRRHGLIIGLTIGSVVLIIVIIVFLVLAQKH